MRRAPAIPLPFVGQFAFPPFSGRARGGGGAAPNARRLLSPFTTSAVRRRGSIFGRRHTAPVGDAVASRRQAVVERSPGLNSVHRFFGQADCAAKRGAEFRTG